MWSTPLFTASRSTASAASRSLGGPNTPAYLERRGRPTHPRQLLDHACLGGRYSNGALCPWEFERDGEIVKVDPSGPLVGNLAGAMDLLIGAAIAGRNGALRQSSNSSLRSSSEPLVSLMRLPTSRVKSAVGGS
jgi:hypothetical protein